MKHILKALALFTSVVMLTNCGRSTEILPVMSPNSDAKASNEEAKAATPEASEKGLETAADSSASQVAMTDKKELTQEEIEQFKNKLSEIWSATGESAVKKAYDYWDSIKEELLKASDATKEEALKLMEEARSEFDRAADEEYSRKTTKKSELETYVKINEKREALRRHDIKQGIKTLFLNLNEKTLILLESIKDAQASTPKGPAAPPEAEDRE